MTGVVIDFERIVSYGDNWGKNDEWDERCNVTAGGFVILVIFYYRDVQCAHVIFFAPPPLQMKILDPPCPMRSNSDLDIAVCTMGSPHKKESTSGFGT